MKALKGRMGKHLIPMHDISRILDQKYITHPKILYEKEASFRSTIAMNTVAACIRILQQ